MQANLSSKPIVIEIRGIGNVPSFKNKKALHGVKRIGPKLWEGNPQLGTKTETRKRKERIEQAIYYQLLSMCQTGGKGIIPACSKQSLIASLPPDDDWRDMEIGRVKTEHVEKGQEGFKITIERIE